MTFEDRDRAGRIVYAFGHLVASFEVSDPHHADSGDLAVDVLVDLGWTESEIEDLRIVAEHVAGNYDYTGRALAEYQQIVAGEL